MNHLFYIIGRNAFTPVINFSITYVGQERKEMSKYMQLILISAKMKKKY